MWILICVTVPNGTEILCLLGTRPSVSKRLKAEQFDSDSDASLRNNLSGVQPLSVR